MFDVSDLSDPAKGIEVASPHRDGRWISDRVSRIVEIINDYDPSIVVEWVPPDQRQLGDPAFRLMEVRDDNKRFVMFYVQTEAEFNESVLERIFQSDAAKNGFSLSTIDAKNDALKAIKLKAQMEELDEANDLAATILKSPLHKFRHNGMVFGS